MSFAQNLAKSLSGLPYTTSSCNELRWRRGRQPSGLGIDRLLASAGVAETTDKYPPTSRQAVLALIASIESSSADRGAQSRAIYYIFFDFSAPHAPSTKTSSAKTSSSISAGTQIENTEQPTGSENELTVARYYADEMWMASADQALVQGLWFLDHGRAAEAMEPLGFPWVVKGAQTLHQYIVAALSDQRPHAVANYLAARQLDTAGGTSGFSGSAASDSVLGGVMESMKNGSGVSGANGVAEEAQQHETAALVRSLAARGKFGEVLTIARDQQSTEFLVDIARAVVELSGSACGGSEDVSTGDAAALGDDAKSCAPSSTRELAQLPFTPEEWEVVREELLRIAAAASPSARDANATNRLVRQLLLVRALYSGDTMELRERLDDPEGSARVFIERVAPEVLESA